MRYPGLILSQGQIRLNEAQMVGTLFGTGTTDGNMSEYAQSTSLALKQVFAMHFKVFCAKDGSVTYIQCSCALCKNVASGFGIHQQKVHFLTVLKSAVLFYGNSHDTIFTTIGCRHNIYRLPRNYSNLRDLSKLSLNLAVSSSSQLYGSLASFQMSPYSCRRMELDALSE